MVLEYHWGPRVVALTRDPCNLCNTDMFLGAHHAFALVGIGLKFNPGLAPNVHPLEYMHIKSLPFQFPSCLLLDCIKLYDEPCSHF